MNAVLGQISIAIGVLLFVIALVVGLLSGVPFLTAAFRAAVVMCVSSVIVAVFFRFLSSVLRSFVMERLEEYNRAKAVKAAGKKQQKAV